MNTRQLLQAFAAWRSERRDLVLATVYATSGSTYSKAGAQMLIDDAGNFQGMLSGGCLEGDLAERAAAVLSSGESQSVTFDLGSSDDGLWGLGVGCDGVMHVFLQPLHFSAGYEPFASAAEIYAGDVPGTLATVIRSAHEVLHPGAALALVAGELRPFAWPDELRDAVSVPLRETQARRATEIREHEVDGQKIAVLYACLAPPPRVLVLGGGLDAAPMVRLITELGWRATVQDHRQAYIENGDFAGAERVCNFPAGQLAEVLDLGRYDAAIVMSHHLDTDRTYLRILAATDLRYIGLLGPPARKARLLADLEECGAALEGRLHGPAGIDIGGRGPASIAVSIVAEMHRQLLAGQVAS